MGIENVKAYLWEKDIPNVDVIAKAFVEFARPDDTPRPQPLKIGDFVMVLDPSNTRAGDYGEIMDRCLGGWLVKFARYNPTDTGHKRVLAENQLKKEP